MPKPGSKFKVRDLFRNLRRQKNIGTQLDASCYKYRAVDVFTAANRFWYLARTNEKHQF